MTSFESEEPTRPTVPQSMWEIVDGWYEDEVTRIIPSEVIDHLRALSRAL